MDERPGFCGASKEFGSSAGPDGTTAQWRKVDGQARHGTRLVYMGHARVTAAEKEGSPHFEENKERGYARLCFVFFIIIFLYFSAGLLCWSDCSALQAGQGFSV